METTINICLGQVVKSKAGRDKGKVFIVIKVVDDKNVLISDGNIKNISSLKKKNIKHLMVYKDSHKSITKELLSNEKLCNNLIKCIISEYTS